MKFTDLQKYKHDTIGKFQTLKDLVESLSEESLNSEDTYEILEAADHAYQEMVKASKLMLEKIQASRS